MHPSTRLLALVALTAGCGGKVLAVSDDAASPPPDATGTDAVTDSVVVIDGRPCVGHDEDGDGVADVCDDCPNVHDPIQSGLPVGPVCTSSLIPIPRRLTFDPFTSPGSWTPYGTGTFASDGEALVFGNARDGDFRFVVGATGAGASPVVVTAIFEQQEEARLGGASGILVRVGPDRRFYLCGFSVEAGFAAARAPDTGCSGGPCSPLAFAMPDGTASQRAWPTELPHAVGTPVGLRATIVQLDGGGATLECRVFDPRKEETLRTTDPRYAVTAPIIPSRYLPSGEVGFFAMKARVAVRSVDILAPLAGR